MVFSTEAPKYWDRGVPVIPIRAGEKRPAINGWSDFVDRMPTEVEQQAWLAQHPNGNLGLPAGPQSGVLAIDVDSDDPRVHAVIDEVLPKSPWKRVGKKGAIYLFKFDGQRPFKIIARNDSADGKAKPLIECLSKGNQFVLPPSIHPDTGKPYTANCELLDVIAAVPSLPPEVESILRAALEEAGVELTGSGSFKVSEFIPAGARDNAMVCQAGILSRAITRGERTLLSALGEMKHWVETYPEKVAGDDLDPEKAQQKVIEFLFRDVTGEKRRTLPEGWDEGLTDEDKKKMGLVFGEEAERWGTDRILQYLSLELQEAVDPNTERWTKAVGLALDRMARNPDLGPLVQDRILTFIANQSKKVFTVGSLRRQLTSLRQGEKMGEHHTEIAKAVLKDFEPYGEVRYDMGRFWQWRGAAWELLDEAVIRKHIQNEYGHMPAARRANDHKGIVAVMRDQCSEPLASQTVVGVNFANGFLTEDLELLPHNPDFGMAYVLPYRYLPDDTKCPMFMQYLADSWGEDPDYAKKILALQEAMAATMMGIAPLYQRAICLYGQAGSGKSRIFPILKGLMPPGCCSTISPSDLTSSLRPRWPAS